MGDDIYKLSKAGLRIQLGMAKEEMKHLQAELEHHKETRSLRDWFAAQALSMVHATTNSSEYNGDVPSAREAADYAYEVADAMMERRGQK